VTYEEILEFSSTLTPQKRLAFGLLIFERMLPELIAFSKETSFDASCLLLAKDAAWNAIQNVLIDENLREACAHDIPDTEKFSHPLTSYALNAALAINELLEYAHDNRMNHLARVSSLAQDSLDLYLSSLEPSVLSLPEEDGKHFYNPLMKRERHQEQDDITFLYSLPDRLDDETLSTISARARTSAPLLANHS
jgi:hypothetical protein